MSRGEIALWMAYREKNGPMNYMRMFDRPAALIGSILSRAHGGKATLKDLMPWPGNNNSDAAPTLDKLIEKIGGVRIGKRKSR